MNTNHTQLFRRAMKINTVESRIIKLTEEIGELLVAITHYHKKDIAGIATYEDKLNLFEEMADVEMCIDTLKDYYLKGDHDFYEKIKEKKIQKFTAYLEGAEKVYEFNKTK